MIFSCCDHALILIGRRIRRGMPVGMFLLASKAIDAGRHFHFRPLEGTR